MLNGQKAEKHNSLTYSPLTLFELTFTHGFTTYMVVGTIVWYLYISEELFLIGVVSESPTIFICFCGELIKWSMNRLFLNLEPYNKLGLFSNGGGTRKISVFRKLVEFSKSIAFLVLFIFLFAIGCIIFGAPLLANREGTITLAMLLVIFCVLPFVLHLGIKETMQYFFYDNFELNSKSQTMYLKYMHSNAVGALLGAWMGSAVVPLDWDRWWQSYPTPNVCGVLLGFVASNTYTFVLSIVDHCRLKKLRKSRTKGRSD